MKKSTILSVATVAAVAATSMGTFAVWDSLSTTAKSELVVGDTINVTSDNFTAWVEKRDSDKITYTATFDINVTDFGNADSITLEPSTLPTGVTIALASKDGTALEDTIPSGSYIDKNLAATNTYEAVVTVTDNTLANSKQNIEIKATATTK